jgi:hypothetical protein
LATGVRRHRDSGHGLLRLLAGCRNPCDWVLGQGSTEPIVQRRASHPNHTTPSRAREASERLASDGTVRVSAVCTVFGVGRLVATAFLAKWA